MNAKISLSLITAFLLAAPSIAATIDRSNYKHNMSIKLTSGKISTTLENFPLLVRLSSARQPYFNPLDCAENGADLRFALPDDTLLAHEIDTWNISGESFI